jgi:hypothetical protein
MDESLGDRIGEVVCHVHDSEVERGLGANFTHWLSSVADRLETGRFRVDDNGHLWLDRAIQPQ